MNAAAIAKTHFVLGGVHVHIHRCRIEFEKQDKGRMASVVEHVPVGLFHRVTYQPVLDDAAIDIKILQVGLAAGKRGHPTHPHSLRPPISVSI